jgi:hypothetical protein
MSSKKITLKGTHLTTPFTHIPYLEGCVYGHPNFPDGSYVQVQDIVWDTEEEAWRSPSGRLYHLTGFAK